MQYVIYEAILCEAIPYEAIRDPWSNPPGIDRPEGGLKTQSPHKTHHTYICLRLYTLQSTDYSILALTKIRNTPSAAASEPAGRSPPRAHPGP